MLPRSANEREREVEKSLSLCIRKMYRAVRSGLVKMCQAKPHVHTSVTDICVASMVPRTTFYDYCTDGDALLVRVASFLLEEIIPILESL